MPDSLLLGLHAIQAPDDNGEALPAVDWNIHRGERIWLDCRNVEAYSALVDVITGVVEPLEGYLEEIGRVVVQTDLNLKATIDPNQSLRSFLESTTVPDHIWLEGKRRPVRIAMDRLGMSPSHFHLPVKLEPPEAIEKLWALRFLVSQAGLLIGRDIFMSSDIRIRGVLAQWWADFPGAVIHAAPREFLPGPVTTRAVLETDGSFHVAPETDAGGGAQSAAPPVTDAED